MAPVKLWGTALATAVLLPYILAKVPQPDHEPRGKSIMETPQVHSDALASLLAQQAAIRATFVAFQAPWCDECKALKPLWANLSQAYDYRAGTRVVEVDCTGSGERACDEFGVVTYPWILAFTPETSSSGTAFMGKRSSLPALRAWIMDLREDFSKHSTHIVFFFVHSLALSDFQICFRVF